MGMSAGRARPPPGVRRDPERLSSQLAVGIARIDTNKHVETGRTKPCEGRLALQEFDYGDLWVQKGARRATIDDRQPVARLHTCLKGPIDPLARTP
jgi:hypothetical protein